MKNIPLIILLSLGIPISSQCAGDETQFIQASQIGIEIELVGALGIPLYKETEVKIEIIKKAARHFKEIDHRIAIIHTINGKLLESPIEIGVWRHNQEPTGKMITVRAMEIALLTYHTPPNQSPFDEENDITDQKSPSRQMLQTGLSIIERTS